MGISGYMIACIVIIIFVVVAIAVLVYVIHWRRKKRKEKTVDVPTQLNRPTGQQTKPNGGNANSDNDHGSRITPTAPANDTLRPYRQRTTNQPNDENNPHSGYVIYNAEPTRSRNDNDSSSPTGDRFLRSLPRLSPEDGDYAPRNRVTNIPRNLHHDSDMYSHPPPPYYKFARESNSSDHEFDEYGMGRNHGYDPMDNYETGGNEMTNNRGFGVHGEYERGSNRGYVPDKEYEMETHHVYDPYSVTAPSRTYYNDHKSQPRPVSATAV